jgi:hypothetical protein
MVESLDSNQTNNGRLNKVNQLKKCLKKFSISAKCDEIKAICRSFENNLTKREIKPVKQSDL